jgi:pyruvate kinase
MNGWTNRETWLVNIWYNPETKKDIRDLKEYIEETYDNMEAGFFKDMLDIHCINWRELSEAMEK